MGRRKAIIDAISSKSLFEKIWYVVFVLAGIACLIFVKPFTFELAFAVSSMFLFMVSENLIANGSRWGFVVSLGSSALYVADCIVFGVYGEVAINLLLYMPLAAYSFFSYKRAELEDGSKKFLKVRKLKWFQLIILLFLVVAGGFLVSLILNLFAAKQSLLNSLSVVAFIVGMVIGALRFIDSWYFDILGNVFTILMWVFVSASNISSLPFVISSLSSLVNDFYGIYYWYKLHKKSLASNGVILNKRPLKISKIITIRRRYKNFVWNKNVDVNKNS